MGTSLIVRGRQCGRLPGSSQLPLRLGSPLFNFFHFFHLFLFIKRHCCESGDVEIFLLRIGSLDTKREASYVGMRSYIGKFKWQGQEKTGYLRYKLIFTKFPEYAFNQLSVMVALSKKNDCSPGFGMFSGLFMA